MTMSLEVLLPPDHVDAESREYWQYIAPQLFRMGRLTAETRPLLVRFCTAWQAFRNEIQTLGAIENDTQLLLGVRELTCAERGVLEVTGKALAEMTQLGSELGLAEAFTELQRREMR